MSQGAWGGGGGGGWGGGGYGPPPGGGGGYGPPGGGGYGPPPGGYGGPPGGGGYGAPPGPYGQGGGGFAPPPAGYPPGYRPPSTSGPVPWEDSSLGFFTRWWLTTRESMFNARAFYAAASQSDNPWPAVTYAVTTTAMAGLLAGLFVGLIYMIFGSLLATFLSSLPGMTVRGSSSGSPGALAFGIMSVLGLSAVILYPVMYAIMGLVGPFMTGGVQHLSLALFGGATKSYTHTVRVVGYSHAAYSWLLIPIPGLSAIAYLVFWFVSNVTGLDETHKCGTGKAVLAMLLIPAACCGCWCGLQALLAGIGASSSP